MLEIAISIIGVLGTALVIVLWWLWRTDRSEQNERIIMLEANRITRPDVERIVEKIEEKFQTDHHNITASQEREADNTRQAIVECHRQLREDISKLTEAIIKMSERRGSDRHLDQ